jgi:ATP-dependent exoDNAse (exonuclease V) beta subunit
LAQDRLLKASGANEESEAAYEAWRREREATLEKGHRPLMRTMAAARVASMRPGIAVDIARVAPRPAERPAGRRFGALVHGILSLVDFQAAEGDLIAIAETQTRLLGSGDEEQKAAIEAVRATLAHELLQRAAAAPEVWRETPLSLRLDDGTVAEGVLDLAFQDGSGWVIVDYKTEDEDPAGTERFRRQVALYAQVLREATGRPARGVVLFV